MTNINIKTLIGNGEMANDVIFTEGNFEWFKSADDGYIYTFNTETKRSTRFNAEGQNGKRISVEVYGAKMRMAKARAEEEAFENAATEEQIDAAWAEVQQMIAKGEVVEYKGSYIPVWGGSWSDPMNSCFYYVTDIIEGQYEICRTNDSDKEVFALRNLNANPAMINAPEAAEAHEEAAPVEESSSTTPAPKTEEKAKKKARKAKKNVAFRTTIDGTEITLTDKQVDFIKHLPDTICWNDSYSSVIRIDFLCDEIEGQFEGKPMTVGAMISTICEKGLGVRTKEKLDGRKTTCFRLTPAGQQVAATLGLW